MTAILWIIIIILTSIVNGDHKCDLSHNFFLVSKTSFLEEDEERVELIHVKRDENCEMKLSPFEVHYNDVYKNLSVNLNEEKPAKTEDTICKSYDYHRTYFEDTDYGYFEIGAIIYYRYEFSRGAGYRHKEYRCSPTCHPLSKEPTYQAENVSVVIHTPMLTFNLPRKYCGEKNDSTKENVPNRLAEKRTKSPISISVNISSNVNGRMDNLTRVVPIFAFGNRKMRILFLLQYPDKVAFGYVDRPYLCNLPPQITFDDLFHQISVFNPRDLDKTYRTCQPVPTDQ